MFSKVSQSLALVNSVSTLLNKGGIACRRPTASQDFCASAKQTQTLTATLLQPCTSRHERKRGLAVTAAGKASEQHALLHGCSQASLSASKLILCQRKHQSMPKHATAMFMLVHAQNCQGLRNSVHAKVSSKEVRNSTVARESLRANKRSPTFHTCKLAVEAGEDLAEAVCEGEPLRAWEFVVLALTPLWAGLVAVE